MAWNEPGGDDKKDPWGGGGRDQGGPPDLDEAFRKLQNKLNGLFGGGKGGSGGGRASGAGLGGRALFGIVLLSLVAWAILGIYEVDEQQSGVVLRLGKYHGTVGSGLHWNPKLIDVVIIENVTAQRQYTSRGTMLTQDENIVELPLTVQYNIGDVKAFVLNVRNPEVTLRHATDSALRHVVGGSKLDMVVSEGRAAIGGDVKVRLQKYLDSYGTGILIIEVNIQEAKPPAEVKAAFDDVSKAKEDQERLKNEAQAYANGIIPEARGKAQRVIEEANAYRDKVIAEAEGEAQRFEKLLIEYNKAPEVTRERLYLDAVQTVMANSSKVMVDMEGGNNMMYLPLDRLMQGDGSGGSGGRLSVEELRSISDDVIDRLRRQSSSTSSSRRREVR
jgi:membrane protease subunit HflK